MSDIPVVNSINITRFQEDTGIYQKVVLREQSTAELRIESSISQESTLLIADDDNKAIHQRSSNKLIAINPGKPPLLLSQFTPD